ncbi:MAG TPA: hypothetical protein VHD87_01670 [Acidimicrobiales bacterium]|nr:hypothetical protein [Acidimicrobiales bacterium]
MITALGACGSSGTHLDSGAAATTTTSGTRAAAQNASCGGADEAFPVETATGPAPDQAEVFADAPGMALRRFLDAGGDPGGGGFVWTGGDWLVLHRGDAVVVYGYRSARGFAYADADRAENAWTVSRYGTCHPRIVGSSGWRVNGTSDPKVSYVVIRYFTHPSCYPPGHTVELDRVEVAESGTEVGLTVFLKPDEPAPGADVSSCGALGEAGVEATTKVTLRHPLGDRTLLDYGAVPHAPPSE